MISLAFLVQTIGITWDGSFYENEPRGDLTEKEKRIIKRLTEAPDLAALDIDTSAIKSDFSAAQITAFKAYQQQLIKDARKARYKAECDDMLFDLMADAVGAGKYPELKPWADKRSEIKASLPVKAEAK